MCNTTGKAHEATARDCPRPLRARASVPWQAAELAAKMRLGMLTRKEQAKLGPSLLAEVEAAAVKHEENLLRDVLSSPKRA